MLPFFCISNAEQAIKFCVENYLDQCNADVRLLKASVNNGFQIVMLPAPDIYFFEQYGTALIVCGFIRHSNFEWDWKGDNQLFFEQLLNDLRNKTAAIIKSEYTGSFTLFYFAKNTLQIFNTFSGLQPVYYHSVNNKITICSSLLCMQSLVKEPLRDAGAIQMSLNEWFETYTRKTMLEHVCRMVPNEYLSFGADGIFNRNIIPFTVSYKPESTPLMDCVKSVWAGYKDIGKQFAGKNLEIFMSLSGGVDSRTCLNAIYQHAVKVEAVNHGASNFYEYKSAARVANACNVPIHLANSKGKMFPPKSDLDQYFLHNGGVVVEYYAIKDVIKPPGLPKILVLGDLFETFKVDGTSVWEGRANKKRTTLKLMFGGKMKFETIAEYGFDKWVGEKSAYFMAKLEKNAHLLSTEMAVKFADEQIKGIIRADFEEWLQDFKHYGLKYVEDFNEVVYWLSKGRTSMWLQSCSGTGTSAGFTLFCTDKNLAGILAVPIKHKLRQKLHFYMFRLPDFKAISQIPTPQIPFTAVSAPLPIKELVMFVRLQLDKMIGRKAAKQANPKKTKLLDGPNYKAEYNKENLAICSSWFTGASISKEAIQDLFTAMMEGRHGAVSTIDFVGLAKADFFTRTCKNLAL